MIDWSAAERIAGLLAGGSRPIVGGSASWPRLPADIQERADKSAARVSDYSGLHPAEPIPQMEGLDRPQWIKANLTSMRPLVDPLVERMGTNLGPLSGAMRSVTGMLLGAQVGALVGMLSQRVLGQFDMVLLDESVPTRLLLVTPSVIVCTVVRPRTSVTRKVRAKLPEVAGTPLIIAVEPLPWSPMKPT